MKNQPIGTFLLFAHLISVKAAVVVQDELCDSEEARAKFFNKTLLNPFPEFDEDPYYAENSTLSGDVEELLADTERVCAITFHDEERNTYSTKDFPSAEEAAANGYFVTHYGKCGACSTLRDLAVYMGSDLTAKGKQCAFLPT